MRRPVRRGKSPAMSLVFSDCAYVIFERPKDAERFAVHAMRSFILNDMPVRMGLSYGSFTNYEFKTGVLPNGHLMFAAPFMGTAVVDSYYAESSGIACAAALQEVRGPLQGGGSRRALESAESEREQIAGGVLSGAAGAGGTPRGSVRSLHCTRVPKAGHAQNPSALSGLATSRR